MSTQTLPNPNLTAEQDKKTLFRILAAVTFCHLLNDMVQSLLPSIYPILKTSFHLNFTQIGLITLTYQIIASLLQPIIGHFTDKKPVPYSLPIGMVFTLAGILLLSVAPSFPILLIAASIIGMGSAVFHPESSRVARLASGGRYGFAQSFFQVGGNSGSAIGPLLAALIILPHGQAGTAWFAIAVLLAIFILTRVGHWYSGHLNELQKRPARQDENAHSIPRGKVILAISVLSALVFSKYVYLASLTSYYTFYLITRFHVSVRSSQLHLFAFLAAVAAGTLMGGPIGDKVAARPSSGAPSLECSLSPSSCLMPTSSGPASCQSSSASSSPPPSRRSWSTRRNSSPTGSG